MTFKRVSSVVIVVLGSAVTLLGAVFSGVQAGTPADPPGNSVEAGSSACLSIIQSALKRVYDSCNTLSRNNACYGHNNIDAELETPMDFRQAGDRVPVRVVRTILTSPLDLEKNIWGLSLLKLQANLPDTMPGQNVMFLIYGNTSIESASGNMQAFYFTTGFGDLKCREAPSDAILVRSPQHMQVTFTANGVKITIASTVLLRAMRNKSLEVQLLEGRAEVSTAKGSQTLEPGQMVFVALGGKNGLEAFTAPSRPIPALYDPRLRPVISLLNQLDGSPMNTAQGVGIISAARVDKPGDDSQNTTIDSSANNSGNTGSGNSNSGGRGGPAPSLSTPTPMPPTPTLVPTSTPGKPTKPPKPTYPPKPTKAPK